MLARGTWLFLPLAARLAGAPPACAQTADSVRFALDVGLGSDLTNQIFYEQEFDSTAFTGRTTVNSAEFRLLGLSLARFALLRGRTSFQAANDLRAGPDLVRDFTRLALQHAASPNVRLSLDAEHDWRRDDSFDDRREDRRAGALAAARWSAPDRAWGARVFARFEAQRTAAGALALVPDFDFRTVGADLDRVVGVAGNVGLSYACGSRSFPDTSARNYREHTAGAIALLRLSDRWSAELWADGALRAARRDSAVGDRFRQGDIDTRLTARLDERWEVGVRAGARATRYDKPTAAFFNSVIDRYAVFARRHLDLERALEVRPVIELARTPSFGGLPSSSPVEDRLAVAREEYDQWAIELEYEDFAATGWFGLRLGAGRRDYFDRASSPDDVSAHSDFWLGEVGGFLDRPIGRSLRVRASADLWSEFHDLSSDDLHSLFLSAELRVPL